MKHSKSSPSRMLIPSDTTIKKEIERFIFNEYKEIYESNYPMIETTISDIMTRYANELPVSKYKGGLYFEKFKCEYTESKLFGLIKKNVQSYGIILRYKDITLRKWVPSAPEIICFFESSQSKPLPISDHKRLIKKVNEIYSSNNLISSLIKKL